MATGDEFAIHSELSHPEKYSGKKAKANFYAMVFVLYRVEIPVPLRERFLLSHAPDVQLESM